MSGELAKIRQNLGITTEEAKRRLKVRSLAQTQTQVVTFDVSNITLAPDVIVDYIGLWDDTVQQMYQVYTQAGGLLLPQVEILSGHVIGLQVSLQNKNVNPADLQTLYLEVRRNTILYIDLQGVETLTGFWTPFLNSYDFALTEDITIEIAIGYVTP